MEMKEAQPQPYSPHQTIKGRKVVLDPGSVIQHPGFRTLDTGSWIQDPVTQDRSRILDTGSRILDPGSSVTDPGCRIRDPGSRILDPRSWIQDLCSRILDRGSRILDPESVIQDPGSRRGLGWREFKQIPSKQGRARSWGQSCGQSWGQSWGQR